MSLFPEAYPEDLTARSARNLVTSEVRTFGSHEERIFIPAGGPFYTQTLIITDFMTGTPLEPITQYVSLHLHNEATLDSGKQVCCILLIKDTSISKIKISYQVPGGKYGQVVTTIRSLLASVNLETAGRISWGSQIYGKPEVFPAAAHRHPGGEFGDWKRFHLALNNIYQAMINKDVGAWAAVYEYMSRSISVAIENNVLDAARYYTKFQIDNLLSGLAPPPPIDTGPTTPTEQLPPKISAVSGNQIEAKPDGLYYNSRLNVKTVVSSYTPTAAELKSNLLLRVNATATSSTVTIGRVATDTQVGTVIHIRQINKAVLIQAGSGVTISPSDSLDMRRTGITATLVYIGSDQWDLITELD